MRSWAKSIRAIVLLLGGAAALTALVATVSLICHNFYASGTWRYKIIVEMETPQGSIVGYSIHQVSLSAVDSDMFRFPDSKNIPDFKGEAVAIDLKNRGVLFLLLGNDPYYELYDAFPVIGAATVKGIRFYNDLETGRKAILSKEHYPDLVLFEDLKNPQTVRLLASNDLDDEFGNGIYLKRISLEIVDAPVTEGILKWLPWLPKYKNTYLDGQSAGGGPSLANILHYGNFRRGFDNE